MSTVHTLYITALDLKLLHNLLLKHHVWAWVLAAPTGSWLWVAWVGKATASEDAQKIPAPPSCHEQPDPHFCEASLFP